MVILVPPIKCQGIKTKIVPLIKQIAPPVKGRWIEPFCGSCVVALNLQPKQALLADANPHIIRLYQEIQTGIVTPDLVRQFLEQEGKLLEKQGSAYYYEVRKRFNQYPNSLDFIFLNRSCFNGVMRFNKKGEFNVPFCKKPNRFTQAYITKIVNQVTRFASIVQNLNWDFVVADFQDTLTQANFTDTVYADPPYAGRHVDYFNSWDDNNEATLIETLKNLPCNFVLSTWHSNEYRKNQTVNLWHENGFEVKTIKHFYHVGSTENLRNPMLEALVTNFKTDKMYELQSA